MTPPGRDRPRAAMPKELAERFTDAVSLGAGAMGGVFSATDRQLGRAVAIKVLHAPEDDDVGIRFLREAETLARIQHPNVLRVLDHGRTREGPYMVMELLAGAPLDPPPQNLDLTRVARDLSAGLEAVHSAKVIHRDVKPANVMWVPPGRAVLIDFGLVHDPGKTALTRTGTLVGTPAYMSPEILMGEPLSPASDWYALGITLYEIAEGERPYGMEDIHRIFSNEGLPPLEFSRLTPHDPVRRLILALTAPAPGDRPRGLADVEALLEPRSRPHRTPDQDPTRPIGSTTSERPGADTGPRSVQVSHGQVVGPAPRRARARFLAAGAVLLAVGVGLAPWGEEEPPAEAPVAAEHEAAAAPAPAPRSPFPADFPRRLSRELEDAMMLARSPRGEVVPAEGNLGRPGYQEFLDPDPARWRGQLAQAAELRRFDDWVLAGGDPLALPAALIEQLHGVGKRYRNQGLSDPFFPLLEGPTQSPGPPPMNFLESELVEVTLRGQPVPPQLGAWFLTAVDAYVRTMREQDRLRDVAARSFQTRQPVGDFPAGFLAIPLEIRSFDLHSLAEAIYALESSRRPMARWTREAHRGYRRFAHAVARSIEEEPETAAIAIAIFREALRHLDGAAHGATLAADPARELALEGDDTYSRVWRGDLRYRASVVQFHMSVPREAVLRKAAADFEGVVADPESPGVLRALAARQMLNSYRDLIDGIRAHAAVARWIENLHALDSAQRDHVYDKVLDVWEETRHPPAPEVLRRIEDHVASAAPGDRTTIRLERIRAR